MTASYGERLQAARKADGRFKRQQTLADMLGVSERAVRNWETGHNEPDAGMKERLREILGPFDSGDPVEAALHASRLTKDRRLFVLSVYEQKLREQDEAAAG